MTYSLTRLTQFDIQGMVSTVSLLERVNRIELSSSVWKTDALTIVLYSHNYIPLSRTTLTSG